MTNGFFVSKLGRPLRGRNDGAAIVSEFEEIELLSFGDGLRVVEKNAVVGRRASSGDGHAAALGRGGDWLECVG